MTERDGEKNSEQESRGRLGRRFNIVWTLIGLILYIATVEGSESLILKSVFEPNPELSQILDDMEKGELEPLPDNEKQRLRGVLLSNPIFMGSLIAVVLIIPLIIGALVGVMSNGILEGAVALGVAAIYIAIADAGQVAILIVALPLDVGLGAAGAWLGLRSGLKKERG